MSSRIYVGRLNVRATERDIERFLKNYGRIRCIMMKNGYGFVVRRALYDHKDYNYLHQTSYRKYIA